MRRKTARKLNIFGIFIIVFIIFASVINICAETASPEITELPEAIVTPTPTPVNNVISVIGDFTSPLKNTMIGATSEEHLQTILVP